MVLLSLLILPYNYNTSHYFMNPVLNLQKKNELICHSWQLSYNLHVPSRLEWSPYNDNVMLQKWLYLYLNTQKCLFIALEHFKYYSQEQILHTL